MGKLRCRTLVDSGAQVSLISKKMYDNLQFKPKMVRAGPKLQAANGESLKVLGSTNLTFTVNGLTMRQTFCVTDGLNRNFILGMDWLKDNGVRDLLRLRNAKDRKDLCETSRGLPYFFNIETHQEDNNQTTVSDDMSC